MQAQMEYWLEKIRRRLPEDSSLAATIQRIPRNLHLVSFRATAFGETFISEVRERDLEAGIRLAGSRLLFWLAQITVEPKSRLHQRFSRIFRNVG